MMQPVDASNLRKKRLEPANKSPRRDRPKIKDSNKEKLIKEEVRHAPIASPKQR